MFVFLAVYLINFSNFLCMVSCTLKVNFVGLSICISMTTGPPVIKQPQYDSQVLLNSSSSITLQCRATGHGSLAYHWERKVLGKWILVNDNNMTSYMTRTSGQYRCNVTDSGSLSTVSPVFTIYGKPVCYL